MAIRTFLAIAALIAAVPGLAQAPPDWTNAPSVGVTLRSFAFDPKTVVLRAGVPVKLVLSDVKGGHSFSAPAFFAAASIAPEDRDKVANGKVEMAGGETVTIRLVPAAGTYKLTCTHFMHGALGMKGTILVS